MRSARLVKNSQSELLADGAPVNVVKTAKAAATSRKFVNRALPRVHRACMTLERGSAEEVAQARLRGSDQSHVVLVSHRHSVDAVKHVSGMASPAYMGSLVLCCEFVPSSAPKVDLDLRASITQTCPKHLVSGVAHR